MLSLKLLGVNFFAVLLFFFACNAKLGNGTSFESTWLNGFFAVETGSKSAFFHTGESLINFRQKLAFSISEFKD